MDLGCDALTDDQLLELLEQGCAALAKRDRFIQICAQGVIEDQGEILTLKREAAKESYEKALSDLRGEIRKEIRQDEIRHVREAYARGELRAFTPEEEAREVSKANSQAQVELVQLIQKELKDGNRSLSLAMVGPDMQNLLYLEIKWTDTITGESKHVKTKRECTLELAQQLGLGLRAALGVPF